jgi:hypothetical protein
MPPCPDTGVSWGLAYPIACPSGLSTRSGPRVGLEWTIISRAECMRGTSCTVCTSGATGNALAAVLSGKARLAATEGRLGR